jgi:hypothetical protein
MGTLQFTKVLRDTTIDVSVWMERLIAEHGADGHSAQCHLVSVIGNDQEISAIAAAISEDARLYARGPGFDRLMINLGKEADVFRSSINVPGRRRAIRHLVACSEHLSRTRAGGEPTARRTVLCGDDPEFLLYRLGVRFGLPVLPDWSQWFGRELERHNAIEPLIGVGCTPVVVKGTRKRFLGWIGHALKRGAIQIPVDDRACVWTVPMGFQPLLETAAEEASRHTCFARQSADPPGLDPNWRSRECYTEGHPHLFATVCPPSRRQNTQAVSPAAPA